MYQMIKNLKASEELMGDKHVYNVAGGKLKLFEFETNFFMTCLSLYHIVHDEPIIVKLPDKIIGLIEKSKDINTFFEDAQNNPILCFENDRVKVESNLYKAIKDCYIQSNS